MEEQNTPSPDLNSKKRRIADLQASLNSLCLDLFSKEPDAKLYNYQYAGGILNQLFEELNHLLDGDEEKKSKNLWDLNTIMIDLPIFDMEHVQLNMGTRAQRYTPNIKNRELIRNQIYSSKIFLNKLMSKYGLESLKQNLDKTEED